MEQMEQYQEQPERDLEQEVRRLKAEGRSIRQIAEALRKPPTTIFRVHGVPGVWCVPRISVWRAVGWCSRTRKW